MRLKKTLSKEEKNNLMQWKLKEKMDKVYVTCLDVYDEKKTKKENINNLKTSLDLYPLMNIFVASFYEDTLYGSNDYTDVNARTVVLEEIQKVRERGECFIVIDLDYKGTKRYILVKDLKFLDLYVGINCIEVK